MPAPDPAPLPRLGEVFFDVRGNSRSMRLSWYADTGVAVFSIWQGGMCTGTFRLAIADLPRMVATLERGPDGQAAGAGTQAPAQQFAGAPAAEDEAEPGAYQTGLRELPGSFAAGAADYREPAQAPAAGYPDDLTGAGGYPPEPAGQRSAAPGYQQQAAGYPGRTAPFPDQAPQAPDRTAQVADRTAQFPDQAAQYSGQAAQYPDQRPAPAARREDYGYRDDHGNGESYGRPEDAGARAGYPGSGYADDRRGPAGYPPEPSGQHQAAGGYQQQAAAQQAVQYPDQRPDAAGRHGGRGDRSSRQDYGREDYSRQDYGREDYGRRDDYRGRDDYQARPAGYAEAAPGGYSGESAGPAGYPSGLPGQREAAAGYPQQAGGYPGQRPGAAGYPAEPGRSQSQAGAYPDQRLAAPGEPGYRSAPPAGYRQQRADSAMQPVSELAGGSYYPGGDGHSGTGHEAGYGSGGAPDYRDPPPPEYGRDSSAAGYGDAQRSADADYRRHYQTEVSPGSGDDLDGESLRYGQPAGNRGAAGRHGPREAPFS